MFAWPAFGIEVDSSPLVIEPVGLFADVSVPLPVDDDEDEDDDVSGVLADDDVVPVGALGESLGWPAPVGVFGVAGSGGGVVELVDGVTGGVALVSVAWSVRLQAVSSVAEVASATARARAFMGSPWFVKRHGDNDAPCLDPTHLLRRVVSAPARIGCRTAPTVPTDLQGRLSKRVALARGRPRRRLATH